MLASLAEGAYSKNVMSVLSFIGRYSASIEATEGSQKTVMIMDDVARIKLIWCRNRQGLDTGREEDATDTCLSTLASM